MASGGGLNQIFTRVWKGRAEYDKDCSPDKDELKKLRWMLQGSTIRVINNCEGIADWDVGSTTNFACVAETTRYREGSAAISLVNTTTTPGDTLTLDEEHRPLNEDWSEYNWLCMWIYDKTTLRTASNNYYVQISNAGKWSAEIAIPLAQTATMWEMKCIDISSIARTKVDGFRFVHRRQANAGAEFFVDYIFITDLITGTGDATVAGVGPVIGPVHAFPVATGQTIAPGAIASLTAGGLTASAANGIAAIGIVCQSTPANAAGVIATDTALQEALVATEGAFVWCRGDATGCTIGNSGLVGTSALTITKAAGTAAGNAERGFVRAMETCTDNYTKTGDQLFQIIASTTEN